MFLKNFILFTLIGLTAIMIACGGETLVTKVDTSKPNTQRSEGVLFSLPQTVVIAEVPLTRVASSPGTFSAWTEFFYPELTPDDFVTEQKTVFKVGMATFNTRGQTDPEYVYMAHIKSKLFETKTLLLEFNEEGIVARTEASSSDDTIDIITSGIKTTASIVAPFLRGGGSPLPPDSSALDIATIRASREALRLEKTDCKDELAAWQTARQVLVKASEKANRTNKPADTKAVEDAQRAVDAAFAAIGVCNELMFKRHLSDEDLALYESLDDAYKKFLRENFGYQFLIYIVRKGVSPGGTGIQFFFTLNEKQQDFIRHQDRGTAPCEISPSTTTNCLATQVKLELLRAKAGYDKILELQKKREELLFEKTGADVNTSPHIEFRLKELDAQIKTLQENFFFGTSAETSGTAKFEFTPGKTPPTEPRKLFKYSRGGIKPGVCQVEPELAGVFKAVVPQTLKGDCHTPDFLVSAGDFRDSDALISRLKNRPAADRLSNYVFGRLNTATQILINNSTDNDTPQVRAALLNALMADLRRVVEGPNIYTATLFQYVELSSATLDLLAEVAELAALSSPTPQQAESLVQSTRKLNRSLLDDAYADELYRQTAWASHQVALEIGGTVDGLAQSVETAQLQENGKRGFPYRLALKSLTKLLDDSAEKGRGSVRIAQFGPVKTLPANLGGRRSSYKISYYDETGAIKVFDMSSDALIQKGNVTDLTDSITTLRDSEAAGLERDTKLLELKKKKVDAEKALKDALKPSPSPTPEP